MSAKRSTSAGASPATADVDGRPAAAASGGPSVRGFVAPPWLGIVLVVTGAGGLLAAFSLIVERIALLEEPEAKLGCDVSPFVSCSGVMTQPQAEVFGFPNPIIGLVAFTAAILVGVLALGRVRLPRWIWTIFVVGVTLGLVFALWLFAQSVFVIGLICPWCFLVYMTMSAMWPTVTIWALGSGAVPLPERARAFFARLSEWSWVVGLAIAVAIVVIIAIALPEIPRFLFS